MRTPQGDLERSLKDPEFAVYFAEAQIESLEKLLKYGVTTSLNVSSLSNRTYKGRLK